MLARNPFPCTATTGSWRDGRAAPTASIGRTWGWGSTTASRPHRRRISAAAPLVRVTTTAAAGTRTSSWARCSVAIGEVRVVQVVHRQHQRDVALRPRIVDHLAQGVDGDGLEAEVHVQHVERADVAPEVVGVQQSRWPPLAGQRRSRRNRVGQQGDARRVDHRTDVGVAGGNRSHSQHDRSVLPRLRGLTPTDNVTSCTNRHRGRGTTVTSTASTHPVTTSPDRCGWWSGTVRPRRSGWCSTGWTTGRTRRSGCRRCTSWSAPTSNPCGRCSAGPRCCCANRSGTATATCRSARRSSPPNCRRPRGSCGGR